MQLSKHTDYGLRVLVFLSMNPDRLSTIEEIATRFDISRTHLMKVVRDLGEAGFVTTVRGRTGGLRLGPDGGGIRVGDVVRRLEGGIALVECQRPGGRCVIAPACRLKGVLARAALAFMRVLDGVTVDELTRDDTALADLLGTRAA